MLIGQRGKTWWEAGATTMAILIENHHELASVEISRIRNMGDIKEETMPMSLGTICHPHCKISTMELNQLKILLASIMVYSRHLEEIIRKSLATKVISYRLTNTARIYRMPRLTLLAKVQLETEMDTFYQVPYRTAEVLTFPPPIEGDMGKSRREPTVLHQVIRLSRQLPATALLSEAVLP